MNLVFSIRLEWVEKDFTLQNDKISLAVSSKYGYINEAKMIEKSEDGNHKYKTHHDFVNDIEEPLSLLKKFFYHVFGSRRCREFILDLFQRFIFEAVKSR